MHTIRSHGAVPCEAIAVILAYLNILRYDGGMSSFAKIKRKSNNLYRGSHGPMENTIMSRVGVGPIRKIAEKIRDNPQMIPDQFADRVGELLLPRLGQKRASKSRDTTMQVWTPGGTTSSPSEKLRDQIDQMFQIGALAVNHHTVTEHVLWEIQINDPSTARLLESTSKKPQTAILYAYGIDPAAWLESQTVRFFGGKANADAFVAVMERVKDDPLTKPYEVNLAAGKYTFDECRHRIDRDEEVLAGNVFDVAMCVPLPKFNPAKPKESLDAAADALKKAKVVI